MVTQKIIKYFCPTFCFKSIMQTYASAVTTFTMIINTVFWLQDLTFSRQSTKMAVSVACNGTTSAFFSFIWLMNTEFSLSIPYSLKHRNPSYNTQSTLNNSKAGTTLPYSIMLSTYNYTAQAFLVRHNLTSQLMLQYTFMQQTIFVIILTLV
jgi:hypothetical protein